VPTIPGVARGRVGEKQLSALEAVLAHERVRGRRVVVAVHHAPFGPDGRPDRRFHGLEDAADLLAIADAHGVSAICHGHIHHRYRIDRPGQTPIFGAGSSTQLGREGYWMLEVPEVMAGIPIAGAVTDAVAGPIRATSRPPSAAER